MIISKSDLYKFQSGQKGARRQQPKNTKSYVNFCPDDEASMTADTFIDDPREPVIIPIGLLDSRGETLLRVIMPIKVKMGFHSPTPPAEIKDTLEFEVAEDMLIVTDAPNMGDAFIDLFEADRLLSEDEGETEEVEAIPLEEVDATDPSAKRIVKLSLLAQQLGLQGIEIWNDLAEAADDDQS